MKKRKKNINKVDLKPEKYQDRLNKLKRLNASEMLLKYDVQL